MIQAVHIHIYIYIYYVYAQYGGIFEARKEGNVSSGESRKSRFNPFLFVAERKRRSSAPPSLFNWLKNRVADEEERGLEFPCVHKLKRKPS